MFPRARELIGAAELLALGQQMAERQRALRADTGRTSTLQRVVAFVSSSLSSP